MQKDQGKALLLSYYSMQLFPALFLEGCLACYTKAYLKQTGYHFVGTPIPIQEILSSMKFFAFIMANEHMFSYDNFAEENVMKIFDDFVKQGYINFDENRTHIIFLREDF